MHSFLQRHAASVMGIVSGWDRLRFRGTLRMLANAVGLGRFMSYTGHLMKDFKKFSEQVTGQVRDASLAVAEAAGRPVIHLNSWTINKEEQAQTILKQDGISEGLICVLKAEEMCGSYNIRSNRQTGHLDLIHDRRRCQHLYHYYIHPVFGFMHVRLQTWLPFNLHVCINGREWLSRQMDATGIRYRRVDNCFTWISDLEGARELLQQQVRFNWAEAMEKVGLATNPARKQVVRDYQIGYYWSLDQSEWATDVLFHSKAQLEQLYPSLIRHGMESFGSRDVMRFLGRSVERGITPRFVGEVNSDVRKRPELYEGIRIKHRVNKNSVKMYNKAGSVLRVETTLNDVRDLQSPRVVNGRKAYERMRKGVADAPRRAEVSQASNGRYLEALAAVSTPVPLKTVTGKLSSPVRWKGKQVRGLNLLGEDDAALLAATGRGEFLINGFRNRDLQALLFASPTDDPADKRRRCGQVTRKLRMLRAHGLIHKLPHTHRYLVSDRGRQVIAALHAAREADVNKLANAA
jgi:hypothetical protein